MAQLDSYKLVPNPKSIGSVMDMKTLNYSKFDPYPYDSKFKINVTYFILVSSLVSILTIYQFNPSRMTQLIIAN